LEYLLFPTHCRQGDPLSPYLFIIGVELLSLQIKSNPKIKGALVNDTESPISQYADDTFLEIWRKNLIGIPFISNPYYPCFRCINFQT
jgi:hypothetical protein